MQIAGGPAEEFISIERNCAEGKAMVRRHQRLGSVHNRSIRFVESLEQRQLFSATLTAAAVEGTYSGAVKESSGGSVPIEIIVKKTEAELVIESSVTLKSSVSAAELVKIRKGTFDVTFKLSGESVTVTGKELSAGKKISGTYKTSTKKTGTFSVTKI